MKSSLSLRLSPDGVEFERAKMREHLTNCILNSIVVQGVASGERGKSPRNRKNVVEKWCYFRRHYF